MNAKTDGWEFYTDEAGRRHWRWPATNLQMGATGPLPADPNSRFKFGVPQQQAQRAPGLPKGK